MLIRIRRNHIRIGVFVLISLASATMFQNCSGGFQSGQSGSNSSGGSVSGSGGGSGTQIDSSSLGPPSISAAERISLCKQYINTNQPATIASSAQTMTLVSGLGDGAGGLGNGDVTPANLTATINPGILPGSDGSYGQNISSNINGEARTPSTISCAYTTSVTCEVVLAESSVTKAINMDPASPNFGQDEVAIANAISDATAKQKALDKIAQNIFSVARSNAANNNNTCGYNFAAPLTTKTRTWHVDNVRSLTTPTGYRCVKAVIKIRQSARTTAENDNASRTKAASVASDYNFITVTVNDGCATERQLVSPNQDQMPTNANYGEAVASNSRWLAVMSGADNNGSTTGVGSITVFDKNNNYAATKIYLPNATGGGSTGDATVAIALSGDLLAASRINRTTGKGAVYVYAYQTSTWTNVTPTPLSGVGPDKQRFGQSLAFSGTVLAIGAPRFPVTAGGNDPTGKVYLYNCNASGCSSSSVSEISNNDNLGAQFGYALSISGSQIAIGAPYLQSISDFNGEGFVSLYNITGTPTLIKNISVANFTNGVLASTITNPAVAGSTPTGRHFGASVALRGSKLLVGAPFLARSLNNGTIAAKAGGFYYYQDVITVQNPTPVTVTGPAADALLGSGVALNSSGAYIGCPLCQNNMGVVQYYNYSNNSIVSTPKRQIFPLGRINRDGFGNAIFVTDSDLIVGSSNRSFGSTGFVGAAYNYSVIP